MSEAAGDEGEGEGELEMCVIAFFFVPKNAPFSDPENSFTGHVLPM